MIQYKVMPNVNAPEATSVRIGTPTDRDTFNNRVRVIAILWPNSLSLPEDKTELIGKFTLPRWFQLQDPQDFQVDDENLITSLELSGKRDTAITEMARTISERIAENITRHRIHVLAPMDVQQFAGDIRELFGISTAA